MHQNPDQLWMLAKEKWDEVERVSRRAELSGLAPSGSSWLSRFEFRLAQRVKALGEALERHSRVREPAPCSE